MKQLFAVIASLALGIVSLPAAAATDHGSTQEAEAMVKKAIVYYQKNGREKALTEFSKSEGAFVDRDLYVSVYTVKGVALAHINPKMVGKDLIDMRDSDGKYLVKERMELAQKNGKGWQDIKFYNPVSKRIEPKRMYFEKHDNLVFSCGAYQAQ
jgi:cytochrome c